LECCLGNVLQRTIHSNNLNLGCLHPFACEIRWWFFLSVYLTSLS
jgi:hypothetical protein